MLRVWLLLALAIPSCAETVLVLPFFPENLDEETAKADVAWIGESLAETIRDALASGGVLALSRDDRLEAFRRLSIRPDAALTTASAIKVGQTLDASHVVLGSFRLTRDDPSVPLEKATLQIRSRVLDLKLLRADSEMEELGALGDLAAIETHLAWQALRRFAPATAPDQEEFRRKRPALRVDAIESYTRGLLAAAPEQKQRWFAQAARLDERFTQPCFELGRFYAGRDEWRFALDWLNRVQPSDSHYLEAQFLLGLARYYTTDYAGAEQAFRTVVASVPLNEVFNNLAAAQSRLARPEAVENFRKALEGDGADPDYHFNLGYALWKNSRFDEAADRFRASLDRQPENADATLLLGRCLKKSAPRQGDPKSDGLERLKRNYEETAYRQLQQALHARPAAGGETPRP